MSNSFSAKFKNTRLALTLILTASAPLAMAQNADNVLRIGYQKYGTLVLLKARGSLEKRLAPLHVEVKWTEFPAGPQLLEGLNVGSIDFGTVGEAPPIFAQAAGADLVYVGNEPEASTAEAIVVPKDSPIKTVAELKGKKVALNKGSNVHYLLVKLLEKAGVKYSDIDTIFLTPADGRAAFERGSVDAWVIWEPSWRRHKNRLARAFLQTATAWSAIISSSSPRDCMPASDRMWSRSSWKKSARWMNGRRRIKRMRRQHSCRRLVWIKRRWNWHSRAAAMA
jgi:ABC-type nitrate/sulfonate/bicarbonate transport system substrate-binding protein